jgi:hypothetical protein
VAPLVRSTPVTVVRNRADDRDRQWQDALGAGGLRAPIHAVPDDPRRLQACWRSGRTLAEGAPRSRIRRALGELARETVPR